MKKTNFSLKIPKINFLLRRRKLRGYLNKAGIEVKSDEVIKKIFNTAIFINLIISGLLLYYFSTTFVSYYTIASTIVILWVLIFTAILFAEWIIFYTIIDLKIYRRKVEIEDVLPDFLQLTAANIKAGMAIDKALWYAVRPRFGVLYKEIEIVAKETIGGEDLRDSLRRFTEKYDSLLLKRSVNMLIEGIDSGGEIGELINRIADNIQEHRIMMKEISASITVYTIFITFAAIIAAPFLFALAGGLIEVIHGLGSSLGAMTGGGAGNIPITFSGIGISLRDFRIFSVVSLTLTSLFSSMIVASLRKGNIKSGLKYIPIFISVSMAIYFLSNKITGYLIGFVF